MSDKGTRDKYETSIIINELVVNGSSIEKIIPQPMGGNDFLIKNKTSKSKMCEAKGSDSKVSSKDVEKSILQQVEYYNKYKNSSEYKNYYTPSATFARTNISIASLASNIDLLEEKIKINWPERYAKIPNFKSNLMELLKILDIQVDNFLKCNSSKNTSDICGPIIASKYSLSLFDSNQILESLESNIYAAKYDGFFGFLPKIVDMVVYKRKIHFDFFNYAEYCANVSQADRKIFSENDLRKLNFGDIWRSLILNVNLNIGEDVLKHLEKVMKKNGCY